MTRLYIGNDGFDSELFAARLQQEIQQLDNRLHALERENTTTTIGRIRECRELLQNRRAVLSWLRTGTGKAPAMHQASAFL